MPDSNYTVRDQQRMSLARNYFAWQYRLVRRGLGRRVLEIGCGIGNFTQFLLDREFVIGIETEPECAQTFRERYADRSNLRLIECDAASPVMRSVAQFQPDSSIALNVLEHIEDDLGVLRNLRAVLPERGTVVLLVPAFPALYGPIDRNLDHYRRYTRRGLRELAARAGFGVREMRYVNAAGFFGWWLNGRVLRRGEQSGPQIAFFDRWIVPLLSRAEAVVPPPFGQSLFAVLEVSASAARS